MVRTHKIMVRTYVTRLLH